MTLGKVLLVEDSVIIRKMVTELLLGDPCIESVSTASNGRLALEKLSQVEPNLVILDVEMPEMDGMATLRELRARAPNLPVIMFSGLTERAGLLTIEALSLGASDYVTKPTNTGGASRSVEQVRHELLVKTRALLKVERTTMNAGLANGMASLMTTSSLARATSSCVELVAIGASTGGPNALAEIVTALPGDLPVPVVIAQHMPPLFTKLFAERLNSGSALRVCEGTMGQRLSPGQVCLAPGDFHLTVKRDGRDFTLYLHQGPPENSCRPSVDVLFRSVAEACGAGALGVVLTGMGEDGLRGCECIRGAGGQILVQDEASSVVWSMPGAVARADLADEILPVGHIAAVLTRRVKRGYARGRADSVPQGGG